ncbi:WD40 repeat-like protein [Pilatotrama ljubarskyi]|nr:WD40 repeat-like protein [Pilatotrama ljubarskyi]KAI0362961.1 WD40 repeat-like protein [Pilatotrama ljubarskyi]
MRDNFDDWLHFANEDVGLQISQDQILFVNGTVKTSRWLCGAYEGDCRNQEASVQAQILSVGNVNVSIAFGRERAARSCCNFGPTKMSDDGLSRSASRNSTSSTSARGSQESAPPKRDQCIFINYFKAKRRRFLPWASRFMEAAAGPHELPPGDRDHTGPNDPVAAGHGGESSDSDFEEMPASSAPYDPVNFLLDYILAHSDASIAIACDTDLYVIFHNVDEFPSDIPAALDDLKPPIDVDEEGAGTLSVNHRILTDLGPSTAESASSAPTDDIVDSAEAGTEVHPAAYPDPQTAYEVEPQGETPHQPEAETEAAPALALASELERKTRTLFTVHAPFRPLTPRYSWDYGPQEPSDPAPQAAPQGEDESGDGSETGLTEEEARLRREQKQPVLPWQPAANGHVGAVSALAYSHDSKLVASGADDSTIVLWDPTNQTIVRRFDGHADVVWALAFSPDDKRLASASADSNVIVWDVETGEQLATLSGHEETIHPMVWSSDGKRIATGSDDMTVRLWDADTYEQLFVLVGHYTMLTVVKFSHDNRLLASGGADYCCRIWDVATGAVHAELHGHKGMIWDVDFDADDKRIVTSSDDASACIWNVDTGELLVCIYEHHGPVWNVSFSGDGERVLTASADSTLKICDAFTGERQLALTGHESMINTACFSPDGKYIASASSDNTVRLWRTADGSSVATFNEHDDKVTLVMFSPDGETLASGADDGTVRIRVVNEWDPDRAEQEEENEDDAGEKEHAEE